MFEIIFLGTGGGRFATITQRLRTGGIRVISEGLNMHVDPGPGALIYSFESGLNPKEINAVLVSHAHLDHTNDAGVLLEAMTRGATRKIGTLAAAHSVLYGNDVCDRAISRYHLRLPEQIVDATVTKSFNIGKLNIKTCKVIHSDPDAVGFRFETDEFGSYSYMPDSELFDDIFNFHRGTRLIILSVLRPSNKPCKGHMTTDDAAKIIAEIRPEMAVITHFGMLMALKEPDREASLIEKRTSVPTIAAKDGMHLKVEQEIHIS